MATLQDKAKSMCEGRIPWTFEHNLRKHLAEKVAPSLAKTPIRPTLREGFTYPKPPVGSCPLWPQKAPQPVTLKALSARQVQELVAEMESQGVLIIVLLSASWATGSSFSSAEHARTVCEAAYGELIAQGDGDKVKFCVSEVSEAGAIYSESRWTNPLVKQYGVKSAPWMLMFAHGKNIMSENPAPEGQPDGAGLGATHRLRYMAFAKPRVLYLEPPAEIPDAVSMAGFGSGPGFATGATVGGGATGSSNTFKLQLETQDTLKRAGFSFDLAVTLADARRMLSEATPPYGMLLVSSSTGSAVLSELAARVRQRSSKSLTFICHDGKNIGPLDSSMQALADKKDLVSGVFERPLTKSRLERQLIPAESVRVNYPKCGLSKETLVQLVQKHLTEV